MQVDAEVTKAWTKVVLSDKVVSKIKGTNTVTLRQQFYCDERTGTIRSVLHCYCLDIDKSMFDIFTLLSASLLTVVHPRQMLMFSVLLKADIYLQTFASVSSTHPTFQCLKLR